MVSLRRGLLALLLLTSDASVSAIRPIWHALPFSTTPHCSTSSFSNITSFTLTEYEIDTLTTTTPGGPAGGTTSTRATFTVLNPGTNETYHLYHIPVSVTGGVWSVCRPGADAPLPSSLTTCQYLIERRSHRIGFRFGWECDGDKGQSGTFDATLLGDLPSEVCVARNGTDGVTQSCGLPSGVRTLELDVANIGWLAD